MKYQPEWINGKTVGQSLRDAEGRYGAVSSYLGDMRGFTALDLGAHSGYFSFRMAEEFNAEVVAVDDAQELADTFRHAPADSSRTGRVTGVFQRVDARTLKTMRDFDVVLCLSVLHHVTWWRSMLDILLPKAKILFVETAVAGEELPGAIAHSPEIPRAVEIRGGRKIYESPGFDGRFMRPLYVIDRRS